MRRVRLQAQRIYYEQVETFKLRKRGLGNFVAVGNEGEVAGSVAEPKPGHFAAAVQNGKRRDGNAAHFEWTVDCIRNELWQPAARIFGFEHIIKYAAQLPPGRFACVSGQRAVAEVQRSYVVQSEYVIRVTVCNEQRVEAAKFVAQRLPAEVGRYVDLQSVRAVLDEQAGAQPAVARIVRSAGYAVAPDYRDAYRSPCSKERKFHFGRSKVAVTDSVCESGIMRV